MVLPPVQPIRSIDGLAVRGEGKRDLNGIEGRGVGRLISKGAVEEEKRIEKN